MLQITIPAVNDAWDERKQEFVTLGEQTLKLEHSLVSISKWEQKWHKAFLSTDMTAEETLDYIRCMTLTQNVNSDVYTRITQDIIDEIVEYIKNPMTATVFFEDKKNSASRETITSELIYYWMIALNIPPEYQKWHLNRLLTLIRVCNIKNAPPKKMSKSEIMSRNRAMNEARKQKLNTKG